VVVESGELGPRVEYEYRTVLNLKGDDFDVTEDTFERVDSTELRAPSAGALKAG
jgi:hypothetical protein